MEQESNDFGSKINSYFDECDFNGRTYTLNGLAHYLGVSAWAIQKMRAGELKKQLELAITRIAAQAEERVIVSSQNAPFWLETQQPELWHKVEKVELSGNTAPNFQIINKLFDKKDGD
jgi:hypothetical protein